MIGVVDYGLGNVEAFLNVYKRAGVAAKRAAQPGELDGCSHIILPGVGAFDHAMEQFSNSGMRDPLERLVAQGDVRILGVCVGMQMLANSSDEGELPGLGWIPGEVHRFDVDRYQTALPMPHMGWNDVVPLAPSPLFTGPRSENYRFYFLHSYYFSAKNRNHVIAQTDYGNLFDCAVQHGQVYGVQFHPEKSHAWGVSLLSNFAEC